MRDSLFVFLILKQQANQELPELGSETQNTSKKLRMLACICNPSNIHSEAVSGDRRMGQKISGQLTHDVAETRKRLFAPSVMVDIASEICPLTSTSVLWHHCVPVLSHTAKNKHKHFQ